MLEDISHGKLSHICVYHIPEGNVENISFTKLLSDAGEGSCSPQAGEECKR